jgi:hypothetical protein
VREVVSKLEARSHVRHDAAELVPASQGLRVLAGRRSVVGVDANRRGRLVVRAVESETRWDAPSFTATEASAAILLTSPPPRRFTFVGLGPRGVGFDDPCAPFESSSCSRLRRRGTAGVVAASIGAKADRALAGTAAVTQTEVR